jgi:hypothetical protein
MNSRHRVGVHQSSPHCPHLGRHPTRQPVRHIRLQVIGFIGRAVGLAITACSNFFEGATQIAMVFMGLTICNVITNVGPNAHPI